jgi:hypothetical protein
MTIGLARHVAIVGVKRNGCKVLVESQKERGYLQTQDVDGRKIYRRILKEMDGKLYTVFIWFRIGCCEDGNEHSGSVKCGKFLN